MATTPSDSLNPQNDSLGSNGLDSFFGTSNQPAKKYSKNLGEFFNDQPEQQAVSAEPLGTASVAEFTAKVMPQAERVAARLGVSVDSIIGQWGLETGWGKSVVPGTNNLGNIKDFSGNGVAATDNATGTRDKYKVFDSLDSFADGHADLLSRKYQGALNAGNDAAKFFNGLKAGGYAEDPTYVEKGTAAAAMVAKARQGMQPAQPEQPKPLAIDSAPKWSVIVAKPEYKNMSAEDKAGVREAYFAKHIAPDIPPDQLETYRTRFYQNADQIEPKEMSLLDRARETVKSLYTGGSSTPANPDAVYDPVTGVDLSGSSIDAPKGRDASVMDNYKPATTGKLNPAYDPAVVGFAEASKNTRARETENARLAALAKSTGGVSLSNAEGQKFTPMVDSRTWGEAAKDTFDSAAKIVPTAIKGGADITAMLTNDAIGRDLSDYMQYEMDNIDKGSSDMLKYKRAELQHKLQSDEYSAGDVMAHVLSHPSIFIDQAAPSVGSMFLPAGAARGAVGLATRVGGNVSKAATVATLGTVAAQNAADTFAELKGMPTEDRYAGAAVSGTVSVLVGIATKGGAEGQIARKMIGDIEKGAVKLSAAREFIKSVANEGIQESGEEFGNAVGEAIGKNEDINPTAVVKRMALAGTLGAAIGGGTDLAIHSAGSDTKTTTGLVPSTSQAGSVDTEQQPQAPKTAAETAAPTTTPVAEAAPTAKPVDTTANKDLVDYAEYRKEILTAKRDGTQEDVPSEDGSKMVTVDKAGKGLSKSEQAELTAIEQAGTDAEKLAAIYPEMKETPANVPEPAKVEQKAPEAKAEEVAPKEDEYSTRYKDRVDRIKNASTKEEVDSILQSEYADGERHMEGTVLVERTAKSVKYSLDAKTKANDQQQKYDSGEWVQVPDGGPGKSAAEKVANNLRSEDPNSEYRVSSNNDNYYVEKRKKATTQATESKQDTISRLMEQAKVEKGIDKPTERNKAFQRGMIDAVEGKEPQRASSAYIAGHTFAQDKLNNKETVKNEPQATETKQAEAQGQEQQAAVAEPVKAEQAATGAPEATAGGAQPDPVAKKPKTEKPKTEKERNQQADYSEKWFGSQDKAQAFIEKKRIGETHEVVKNGAKFEIKAKAAPVAIANPETPTNPSYELPEKDVAEDWRQPGASPENPNYKPNDRQKKLIDAVATELDAGVFYNSDLVAKVAKRLNVPDDVLKSNKTGVQNGDFGYDVYYARKYVESQKANNVSKSIAGELNLNVGDSLGTIVTSDFKQTTNVKIDSISDSGLKATVTGKRGKYIATIEIGVDSIKNSINRAKERGNRKDSYDDFIANKLKPKNEKEAKAKKAAKAETPKTENPAASQSDAKPADDLDAMFDDVLAEEVAKTKPEAKTAKVDVYPMPSKKPKTEKEARTTGQAAVSAAKNTAQGFANAINGLGELFGGNSTFGSGPVFNEYTYAKAKPLFQAAIDNFSDAGADIKEVMRAVVKSVLDQFGESVVNNMKPYIVRFVSEYTQQETKEQANDSTTTAGESEVNTDLAQTEQPAGSETPARGTKQPRAGDGRANDRGVRKPRGRTQAANDGQQELGYSGGVDAVSDGQNDAVAGSGKRVSADFIPAAGDLTRTGSWFDTAKRNIDLIELAIKIESENRNATPEEQAQLAKYVGFGAGAIRNTLFPIPSAYAKSAEPSRLIWPNLIREDRWRELANRMEALPQEWQKSVLQSSQYAHYTSEGIIRSTWSAMQRLGFTGGKVFEPGMGIGSFSMLMPENVRNTSKYTGIEFDGPTALIAKLLQPEQHMLHDDFIKRKLPKDFFDVAIGNPPFSQTQIYGDPDYEKYGFMLHDFFFAKAIDRVRPGGLLAFVTSKGTMDKQNDKARKYLSERADLLGAIRLPSTAFEDNAGTSVVTDVIFLRKRAEGEAPAGKAWGNVATVDTKDGPVVINEYFAANPEMVLGQNRISGNVDDEGRRINSNGFGGEKYTVVSYDKTPAELDAKFAAAVERLPENVYSVMSQNADEIKAETAKVDFDPAVKREGVVYIGSDGTLMRVESGVGKPLASSMKMTEADVKWFKGYVGLREMVQTARHAQVTDGNWEAELKKLNKAYDAFRKEHGPINDFRVQVRKSTDEDGNVIETESRIFKNRRRFREDYDAAILTQLETINEAGEIVKSPFLNGRTIGKPVSREVKSIGDALAVSLDSVGRLNIDDVAKRIGLSTDEAIEALGNQIYKAPKGEWQLADEYLSGDVVAKLEEAELAARIDPSLKRNVEALKEVQPEKLGPSQISAKLGASWIPVEHVNAFVKEIDAGQVTFDPKTESWQVAGGNERSNRKAGAEYGTAARSPSELLEAALNSRSIKITSKTTEGKTVTDTEATTAANEMLKKIKDKFKGWVWTDTERAAELMESYNKRFNNIAPRRFDGSHLTLPGVSLRFKLHPHQLRAIWRIIQTGNTYLAHAVGAGKTIEMIAAGMEQKRLGLIKKPLYVVPNHMLEQFSNEFMELYPLANIMVADDENFSAERRKAFIANATLNNPDAVIITHDAYQRIGIKEESVAPIRDEILADLEIELSSMAKDSGARVRRSQLEQQIEAVTQRFDRIIAAGGKDSTIKFEDIGVDFVFTDEAHAYRKLDFHTAQQIKGIDPNGSKRALDMYVKTRWLEKQRPGRSMVFASGTPVTNTMGELYTIMRFFAQNELDRGGISTFDAWARQFGEVMPALEPNAAGKYELVERFAKFDNVPELMSRVRQFMDVLTSENLGALVKRPDLIGGKPNLNIVMPSDDLQNYMTGPLAKRIEESKKWKPSKDQPANPDPIVAIITDGRFAAIDPRFFGGTLGEDGSIITEMAKKVAAEYHATKDNVYLDKSGKPEAIKGSTQIVFYNLGFGEQSQKSRGFNSRAAFTKALTDAGVKRDEIAWFDDANTDAKKEAIFKDMRSGKVRILIGSAKKMGTGVNVQKRLSRLHYQDPPWFPADVEQPHGRIIRQGNQNSEVGIEWYTTKGTYQSTMWQMVARKQRFIDQAFTGDKNVRSMDDLGEASLFEQAAAVASGDPRAIQLAGLKQDVERLERLQAAHANEQINVRSAIRDAEWELKNATNRIATYGKAFKAIGEKYFTFTTGKVGSQIFDKQGEFGQAIKEAFNKNASNAVFGKTKEVTLGQLSDAVTITMDEDYAFEKPTGKFTLYVNVDGMPIEVATDAAFGEAVDATGLARRIVNHVNSVEADLKRAQQAKTSAETDLNKLNKKYGAPFEYQQDLLEKYAELKTLEDQLEAEGEAKPEAAPITIDGDGSIPTELHDLATNGPAMQLEDTQRVATLARLKSLTAKLESGKITNAEYLLAVKELTTDIQARNESRRPEPKTRGAEWIKERLMRANRLGEIKQETADFALWFLEKYPHAANDLAISIRSAGDNTPAGSYRSAERLMTLFKGSTNEGTATHEILHHMERMMPPEIQRKIMREWQKAWNNAWSKGDDKVKKALSDMLKSSMGDKNAFDSIVKAFRDGTLNYDEHYQLTNASEYWAVNATRLLSSEYAAKNGWSAKAKQFIKDLIAYVKKAFGVTEKDPIVKALNAVLNGNGKEVTDRVLAELTADTMGLNDLAVDKTSHIIEKMYKDRDSFFIDGEFDTVSYNNRAYDIESELSKSDFDNWQNNGWVAGAKAMISDADRKAVINKVSNQPMYHATNGEFKASAFDLKSKGNVAFISPDKEGTSSYGNNIIEVSFKPKNPLIITDSTFTYDMDGAPGLLNEIRNAGYDSIIGIDNGDVVVLSKSAIAGSNSILQDLPNQRETTERTQQDLIKEFGKPTFYSIDWWDKSVGTQFHKAAKNPHYAKVFNLFLSRENATSITAVRAAELAPGFLPRVDDFKSAAITLLKGKKASKQHDLAGQAILEGTLQGDSVLQGVVWSDEELRGKGLDEQGIALYRQARQAIDASLDEVAAAEGYAAVQMFVPRALRDTILDNPKDAVNVLRTAIDKRISMDMKRLKAMTDRGATDEAVADLEKDIEDAKAALETMENIFGHSDLLKDAGYAPLMRFGKYFVSVEEKDPITGKTIVNDKGEPNTLFFSRYETESEAQEAYFRMMSQHGKDQSLKVISGPVNNEKYKMYAGISPETLALFAEAIGAKEVENKFYQQAISERSALKRRLERKAIAGYSQDLPRVLANFITSNGRHAAGRYYTRDINSAIKFIPREKGDVQEEAQKLKEFLDNPKDAGAMASGLAFTWFLGGNPASAAINATQPVMMTLPYLSQWGAGKAAAALTKAVPVAMGKKQITDAQLRHDLKRASQEGKVDAQEIFHLYTVGIQGVAGALNGKMSKLPLIGKHVKGASESGRARMNAALTLWGMPFAVVEGFNRRLSFIAAWNMAKEQGEADPYAFAVRAVDETQGIYNKVNRPNWARSGVGRTVFTFTQFRVMNVELLKRMATQGGPAGKRAAALYLSVLILAAGFAGLPYADDVDDIIDTVGQFLGYDTNMKRKKREWAYNTLGKFYGDLALYGMSSQLPMDFGGRMGLGNMVPATGVAKLSNKDKTANELLELGGPVIGGLGKQAADAYEEAAVGNYGKAAAAMAPSSVKNLAAGLDMIATGKAKDLKGREKIDVTPAEGAIKAFGFNPTKVANISRQNMPLQQDIALQKIVESNIVDKWAQGVAQNDQAMVSEAMNDMEKWNRKNPDTPVAISPSQIMSKAKSLMQPADTRMLKSAPKEMRGRVAAGLSKFD